MIAVGRNNAHKCAQQQLHQSLATGVATLDFIDDNPLDLISSNAGEYQADLLTGNTEVHAGNRVIDVGVKTRDEINLECKYALEVIDTSPPDYGALINHLRSGYAIALVYITDEGPLEVNSSTELVQAIEKDLFIEEYDPGWINLGETASLGTILSLNNTRYAVKSWANDLAPRLNSKYTWTYTETVVHDLPVNYPVTCLGKFEAVKPDCLESLNAGLYTGYHDHTQHDPIVYLVDHNQEYVRLEIPELQAIQTEKALSRVTPLPGSTPSF